MTEQTAVANPYVGPRTFSYEQRHLFFGREREAARDLTARFLSERLLLFYAQSGAGKSSLLQTRIIPQLRGEKGFGVLPVARVSGELLPGIDEVDNIYVFNLMTSIDDGQDPSRLASVSISDFLARLVFKEGKRWEYDGSIVPEPAVEQPRRRYALIIDQFEEIISAHPSRWRDREDFFRQLEEAMHDDPNLWVMLTLREDYVAALDPYANLMTDRLRARFYMERMSVDAAMQAVQRPANEAGERPFAGGVAEKLVDDLRQIRTPGQEETVPGQHVEPVQLQVVCYQLWEKLKDRPPGPISMDDLEEAGDVDRALAGFYEDAIAVVIHDAEMRTSEGALRTWFDASLITEAGTRGSVYQGRRRSAGMSNRVVESLANQFLLRRELRAGGAWIELVHDRFVGPIRQSNREWLDRQSPLMRAARDWENRGRPPELLLTDAQLEMARLEAADASDPLITAYLMASEEAASAAEESRRRQAELDQARLAAREAETQRRAEEERAQMADARRKEEVATSGRLRRLVIALVLISLIAGTTAIAAAALNMGRQEALETANKNYAVAVENFKVAEAEQAVAAIRSAEALAAQATAEVSEDLAIRSAAEAMAAQQTAEADRESASKLAANLAAVLTAQAPTPTPKPSSLSVVLTLIPGQPPEEVVVAALDAILIPTPTPTRTPTPNLEATAVVVTAQAQLAQVQATQTVVAEAAGLTAVIPDIVVAVNDAPSTRSTQLTTVRSPQKLPMREISDDFWVGVELPTTGETGWIYGYLLFYEGSKSLLPEELHALLISGRDDLPFVEGEVISYGGAAGDDLLTDADDQQSGIRWVPVGTKVTLLEESPGDPAYGSGVWYLVALPDPEGSNQLLKGYLPQEVLAPVGGGVAPVTPPNPQSQSAPQSSELQPGLNCRDGWRIEVRDEPELLLNPGEMHRGYVTLSGEAKDSPYQVVVGSLSQSTAESLPIWTTTSPLAKEQGVLAVLDTHDWVADTYSIALVSVGTTDSQTSNCTILADIPAELPIPGIEFENQSDNFPEGPPAIAPPANAVFSAGASEIVFEWEAEGLEAEWVYDLLIQWVDDGKPVEVTLGGPGVIEWRLPTSMTSVPISALGGPGAYQWQVRYAENKAEMVHRSGAWGSLGSFVIE